MRHIERQKVLGVDPSLVLVFELAAPVDLDEFRRAGLRVLDGSDSRVVVAFADDPSLAAFNERLEEFQGPIPEGQKSEPHAGFFDSIENLRAVLPEERLTQKLRDTLTATGEAELRLDIECWHPDDADLARQWLRTLRAAVEAGGGRVADIYVHDRAGLLLMRAYARPDVVRQLAEIAFVATIDVLPVPSLTLPELYGSDLRDMPPTLAPADGAPIVGIIDSGVRSAHPLLAGVVVAADPVGTGVSEGEDQHGHGTMVAALIAHGPVEAAIRRSPPARPLCHVVSARVLDGSNRFPDEDLWEHDLARAVEWCVGQGASVINVSLGDSRSVMSLHRQMNGAAVLDDLARLYDITIVTCTGNVSARDYLDTIDESVATTYPEAMLRADHARLIDPGTAMLALTVGAVTMAEAAAGLLASETVVRVPMGKPGWPSPFSRVGPGVNGAVKPELVELGGTLGIESGRLVDNDAELGVISASAKADRLLAVSLGTSFAAPLVTRVAAAVKARFPGFSSNQVRALVLLSAVSIDFEEELQAQKRADREEAARRLVGYGRPRIHRAIESTSHRVVLVAEDAIPIDGVHVYELPVPDSFRRSGGQRGIDIALAYSPPTRARRLDYLASRMEFFLVRGISLDEIVATFARLDPEDDTDIEGLAPDRNGERDEEDSEPVAASPPTISELGAKVCALAPSNPIRSKGANQLGRRVFSTRFDPSSHEPMHLVVRNTNRWDDDGATQPYALACAMWRTETQPELHAELQARLEAVVELPVQIELEV